MFRRIIPLIEPTILLRRGHAVLVFMLCCIWLASYLRRFSLLFTLRTPFAAAATNGARPETEIWLFASRGIIVVDWFRHKWVFQDRPFFYMNASEPPVNVFPIHGWLRGFMGFLWSSRVDNLTAAFPLWFLVTLVGATCIRMRRSPKSSCCTNCGYDLRASLGRCPECGTPFPKTGEGKTPIELATEQRLPAIVELLRQKAPSTTQSATGKNEAEPSQAPQGTIDSFVPNRRVNAAEINRIRQVEWNRKDRMNVRIDWDARHRFAEVAGMLPSEFDLLPPAEQARRILNSEQSDLKPAVHLLSDPYAILEFYSLQRSIFKPSCATVDCHGRNNPKSSSFWLFDAEDPRSSYSNFLTMQLFKNKIQGQTWALISRGDPDHSLMLQFMLPPTIARPPHPAIAGYKGAVQSARDRSYEEVRGWIEGLLPSTPDYRIDLTK